MGTPGDNALHWNLKQLEAYVWVAKLGSFRRTAERLREAYGVEAVVGSIATPQGARHVCAPLVEGA